jgi:hypothetical protein
MIRFNATSVTIDAAASDGTPSRTITGIAAPYNVVATVSDGTEIMLSPGALPVDGPNPKLFVGHQSDKAIGTVIAREDTPEGMLFQARVAKTVLGEESLQLALENVYDQVSVGIAPLEFSYNEAGVMLIEKAAWTELSLVSHGAFGASASITQVAASIHQNPDETDNNPDNPEVEETEEMQPAVTPEVVEAAAIPTAPVFAAAKRDFVLPTAGEFMAAFHIGGDTFANMNKAVADYTASKRTPLQAAAGDVLTTDTLGLLSTVVLGPLVQDLNFLRPVVEAVGARAYPDNGQQKTFIRPTITTHTSVAAQANELAATSATTMVIASNSVSKTTLAGQVTLSQQDIDFTNPAAMQLILNDLMGEYMIASDNLCADNLLTAATSSGVWDGTVADLYKSIFDSANDISSGRNWLPTHLFVSVDVWSQLGQLVDSTGRAIFPLIANGLSGQNAAGSLNATSWNGNPLGLQLVVDSNFAAKTMIVTRVGQGQGDAFEYYESIRGLMSVEQPAVLGRNMSFHGYASTFAAIPGMIRKITQA